MPRPRKSHDDYVLLCCFFCWKKGDQTLPRFEDGDTKKKPKVVELIEQNFVPAFLKLRLE